MTNAAKELVRLLDSWDPVPAGKRSEDMRGAEGTTGDRAFWQEQARAVGLLLSIEQHLTGMAAHGDEVEHYLEALPAWYRAVFSYEVPWNQSVSSPAVRPIIDKRDLRMLRALAGAIDSLRMVQPLLDDQVEGILVALDGAEEVIRGAVDVTNDVRRYLLGLVHEARRVTADWRTFGSEPVRSKNLELGGALYTMAEQAQEPAAEATWREAAKAVTLQVLGGSLTQAAIVGGTAVIKQIGG